MSNAASIDISGLSELQLDELKAELEERDIHAFVEHRSSNLGAERHGEPTLVGLAVTATPVVLSAIAVWLSKQRSKRTESMQYEKVLPDGTVERLIFNRSDYEEGEAGAGAIEVFLRGVFNVR